MSKDPGYLDPGRRGWKGSSKDVLEVKKVKKGPSVTSEADSTSCFQPGAKIRNSSSTANIPEDVKECMITFAGFFKKNSAVKILNVFSTKLAYRHIFTALLTTHRCSSFLLLLVVTI